MKKATRLLILTAFVLPLLLVTRAYAGGPGPGQRMVNSFERERLGLPDPFSTQRTDPFDLHSSDGIHATEPENNPFHLQDPIGNPGSDMDRNELFHRSPLSARDPFPGAGSNQFTPTSNGGGTAPIDGGISLLLAAGLGLGIKKARARKQTV